MHPSKNFKNERKRKQKKDQKEMKASHLGKLQSFDARENCGANQRT